MKIWFSLPFLPLDVLPDLVSELERVGVDGVTVSDHLCVPAALESTYPYTGRRATLPLDTEFADPIALIAALGARTTTLRFMTHVLLAPLRHPIVLAKELATISVLNGGRLDVGVGVGWMREEFEALGIPFERRGAILDEELEVMRRLWTGEVVDFAGEHFRFEPMTSLPTPHGRVTLLGGGYSPPALRRASRLDGWLGVTPTMEELRSLLADLDELRCAAGRESDSFVVRSGVKGTLTHDLLVKVRDLGVDALIVTPHQVAGRNASPDDIVSRSVIELSRLVDLAADGE